MIKQKLSRALLFCCVFSLSCVHRPLTPHYSDRLIDSALALGGRGQTDASIRLVDRHFASFPYRSILDRYRYLRFRFDLYNSFYSPAYSPSRALAYADSMVDLLQTENLTDRLPAEYAAACNLQGQIYIELKRYSEAFRVYGLCRLIAERTGDRCLAAQYKSAMGTIRFRQGEYQQAAELYKTALAGNSACPFNSITYHDVQGVLANIALAYTRLGKTDSALAYYQKAENYIQSNRSLYTTDTLFPSIALAVVYGNEALAVQAAGDYDRAESLLKKAMAINNLPGRDNATGIIETLHLAALYLTRRRTAEAQPLLQQTAGNLPADDETTHRLWLSLMAQYEQAVGDPAKAVQYLQQSQQLGDSIALKDRRRYAASEDNIYQLLEAQHRIDLLKKNDVINKMYLFTGALILIAVTFIALLVRISLRRHQHMLGELTARNESITRQQAQLQQLLAELDQRDKEKDRILRIVAHDLRSPIGGIKMMSTLLTREDPVRQKQMFAFIQRSAANCLTMVNDLLAGDFSRERVELDRSSFDLRELVTENTTLMQFNANEKNQTIEVKVPDQEQPVLADAPRLGRVLNNLIGNAIKFSPCGSTILVILTGDSDTYRLSVRDQGIGIPASSKGQVFDAFSLARRARTQGERSFGLGLSISKQIIEAHHGNIWFESEEGTGTDFHIELPLFRQ